MKTYTFVADYISCTLSAENEVDALSLLADYVKNVDDFRLDDVEEENEQ